MTEPDLVQALTALCDRWDEIAKRVSGRGDWKTAQVCEWRADDLRRTLAAHPAPQSHERVWDYECSCGARWGEPPFDREGGGTWDEWWTSHLADVHPTPAPEPDGDEVEALADAMIASDVMASDVRRAAMRRGDHQREPFLAFAHAVIEAGWRPPAREADTGDVEPCCDHGVVWHHTDRGCGYHGFGPDRCPCLLTHDEALAAHVAAREAQWRRSTSALVTEHEEERDRLAARVAEVERERDVYRARADVFRAKLGGTASLRGARPGDYWAEWHRTHCAAAEGAERERVRAEALEAERDALDRELAEMSRRAKGAEDRADAAVARIAEVAAVAEERGYSVQEHKDRAEAVAAELAALRARIEGLPDRIRALPTTRTQAFDRGWSSVALGGVLDIVAALGEAGEES